MVAGLTEHSGIVGKERWKSFCGETDAILRCSTSNDYRRCSVKLAVTTTTLKTDFEQT
jgi:hypothetical protein